MSLHPDIIRQAIENLRLHYPELEDDDEAWLASLESETDLMECLAKIVEQIDEAQMLSIGVIGRIAVLQTRLEWHVRKEKALRSMAKKLMDAAGITKAKLALATLSIQQGRESVRILDEASVPDALCKIERKPKLTDIKNLLQSGTSVNWAVVERSEPTLSIRVK